MISLVVFLGNPGAPYSGNRHNAARQFASLLPFALAWRAKFRGKAAALDGARGKTWLLQPETFMNNSGESAGEAARFLKLPPETVLAVHDELELPLGAVSLKQGGGLGGHNGLRSITAALGTRDFWRLRFGIGRPEHRDIASYVLSDFLPGERPALEAAFALGRELFALLLEQEPEELLGEWARKNAAPPGTPFPATSGSRTR